MAFLESLLVTPKIEPKGDSDPSDDFIFCNVKQEPGSVNEPKGLHFEEHNYFNKTNPGDYHLLEVKEESYNLDIFEEPEFKYDLTNPILPHREERYLES